MEFNHKPVLLNETIEGLNIKQNGIYVDGTLGGAGHSKEILKKLDSSKGFLIGIDRDEEALKAAKQNLKEFENVKYVHNNHDNIKQILHDLDIKEVDGILLDLGVSSYQLDERNRGFSYLGSNDLDMRMDKTQRLTAKEVINNYSEEHLANIIYEYGEEKYSRQIAKNICIQSTEHTKCVFIRFANLVGSKSTSLIKAYCTIFASSQSLNSQELTSCKCLRTGLLCNGIY